MDSWIASTYLFRLRTFRDAAASLVGDRRRLARVDGLRFSRLVFVGGRRTEGFTPGLVDPRRQLAICLWQDAAALERFERSSPIACRWRESGGPERLYRGAMTFTIWESLEHALAFAYREQPHKQIVADVRKRDLLTDSMFIRFEIETTKGDWPSRSRFAARFGDFARLRAMERAS